MKQEECKQMVILLRPIFSTNRLSSSKMHDLSCCFNGSVIIVTNCKPLLFWDKNREQFLMHNATSYHHCSACCNRIYQCIKCPCLPQGNAVFHVHLICRWTSPAYVICLSTVAPAALLNRQQMCPLKTPVVFRPARAEPSRQEVSRRTN